jgi:CRP-like cAMP-binding protein
MTSLAEALRGAIWARARSITGSASSTAWSSSAPFLYPGVGQKLQVSQEEIGNLSGISRQRVNQALQALEREGLLRVEYGGVTILNLEGLRQR